MKTTLARLALGALLIAAPAGAQTAASLVTFDSPFIDNSTGQALPCVGCTLRTYAAGTSTPVQTYVDSTATTKNAVSITLDSAGFSPSGIWISTGCIKVVLASAQGVTLRTTDHICDNGRDLAVALRADLASTGGAALVGFEQAGSSTPRTVAAKLAESLSVLDYGAVGNYGDDGAHDDTDAITAAIAAACALPSGRVVKFPAPAAGGYLSTVSTVMPCGRLTFDFSNGARWFYTSSGDAIDTNGMSDISFVQPFLAGPGGVANQNGIHINNSNGIKITGGLIGAFGVAPTITHITACTNANPTVCSAPSAPSNGDTVQLGGFSGGAVWPLLNSPLVATRIDSTHFSLPADTTTAGALTVTSSSPAWGTNNASGCGIKITGDSQGLDIGGGGFTIEAWGKGICGDGPTDNSDFHNIAIGASSDTAGSGKAIELKNSVGAGAIKLRNINMSTPGGAIDIGPNGGQYSLDTIQYENLANHSPLMNDLSSAYHFGSALNYHATNISAGLHGYGNRCFVAADFSGGSFDTTCFDSILEPFDNSGLGANVRLCYGTNLAAQTPKYYTNPEYPGICTVGFWNGWQEWGGVYPQSPFDFHSKSIPINFKTTLAAAITTTSQTAITLYSWQAATVYAVGFQLIDSNGKLQQVTTAGTSGGGAPAWATITGDPTTDNTVTWKNQGAAPVHAGFTVLRIGAEQLPVNAVSFPNVTVTRGANNSTAATALSGASVTLGPSGTVAVSATTQSDVSGASLGFGVGYNTETGGPYGYLRSSIPGLPEPTDTPIPLLGYFSSFGPIPLNFNRSCTPAMEGQIASFINSGSATVQDVIVGGGSHHVAGYCDGVNWTVMTGR